MYSSLMTWTGYFRDRLATKLRRLHRVGGKRRAGIPAVGDRATRMPRAGPRKAAGASPGSHLGIAEGHRRPIPYVSGTSPNFAEGHQRVDAVLADEAHSLIGLVFGALGRSQTAPRP